MEITKYAGHTCMRCRMLDKMMKSMDIPCEVTTKYVEDEGEDTFMDAGVESLPTLVIQNGDKKVVLSGAISPTQLREALEEVK